MTLVLGRPGAGCSTLLRTLAGVSSGLSRIEGDIRYNGIPQKQFIKEYPDYLTYNPEDDLHYPTLTVRETLFFALECKVGAAVPKRGETPDQARYRYINEHVDVYLRIFGLLNCANTLVGNEFVRGCSGGEKKRVSIAEQLCIGASMGFWDGSTKGLDASTALDFIRALRVLTDLSNQAQVVSLYQASEDMYELFDNVCLVAEGRVIYYGPTSEAKNYFVSLGFVKPNRKVTPDFLTGITDKYERDVAEGKEGVVPNSIEEYEAAYKNSKYYKNTVAKVDAMIANCDETASKFPQMVLDNKKALGLPEYIWHSEYTTTFSQQIVAACRREFHLSKRDVTSYGVIMFDIVMALVVGFVFFNLPDTAQGAFSRGGVVFFSMIFMAFNSMGALPLIINGRAINGKHKSYRLYRTHLQTFCTQLMSLPVTIVAVICWTLLVYFLAGLRSDAGAFFTFILFLVMADLAYGSLNRMIASLMPDLNVAMMSLSFLILACVTFSGYVIPYPMIPKWAHFIFWMNPLQWAVRAMLENEYTGLQFPCDDTSLLPGDAYAKDRTGLTDTKDVLTHSACMIAGSVPGQRVVDGLFYVQNYYGFGKYNLYFNVLILLGYIVLGMTVMIIVNKHFGVTAPAYAINVWKRNRALFEKEHPKVAASQSNATNSDEVNVQITNEREAIVQKTAAAFGANKESFTWKHVNYTVTLPDGTDRQLLNDVQGFVKSGQLIALMGSSGAGKTTLMDCITQRKTTGVLEGQIYVGEKPQGSDFRSITSYCEQIDVHNSFSTVRECVRFSARLRQPDSVPLIEKFDFADLVLSLLELDNIADALVGRPNSENGISMEERKRLTIACELASKPKILFLDEPTSGLDSQAAFTIMRLLRNLADKGQAILCTIHQPSAVIFEKFDKLLLLARGGVTVYFGDLGKDCSTMIGYFESHGAPKCPPTANPAEYMLECIGAGVSGQKPAQDWVSLWNNSDANVKLAAEIDGVRNADDSVAYVHKGTNYGSIQFKTPFSKQIPIVYARMFKSFVRNPNYTWGRISTLVLCGCFLGLSFLQSETTMRGTTMKVFSIFSSVTISALFIGMSQPNYHEMRTVFLRERETGTYDWKAFYAAIVTCEWPWIFIASSCYFPIFYYLVGFYEESERAVYFWLIFTLFNLFCVSLGQMIIAPLPNVEAGTMLNPLFMSIPMLLCGVTQPYPSMPKFWHWIYWINPFHYYIEGILGNEMGGRVIECDVKSSMPFIAPTGMTCAEYMKDFFEAGYPGSLQNPNDTGTCHYCTFNTGDQMMDVQMGGWTYDNRWRNFGFVAAFWGFNILVLAFSIRWYKVSR
eukprot:GDKJ01061910.1.p1 GENE.GDKJ01061910.1~~GDKJ01061910.1.p1  ORF type:complete len:1495 (-),score=348.67 GDKJ01061910.1:878-4834(-)